MTTIHKKRGLTWLIVALIVAAIAQFVLIFPWGQLLNDFYPLSAFAVYTTAGTILYALAGVFLALSLRSFGDALPPFPVSVEMSPRGKPRFIFWVIGLSLSGIVAIYATYADHSNPGGYAAAGLWLLSIGIAIFGVLREMHWRRPTLESIKVWVKANYAELLVVTLIVLAAFVIRIVDVELHPYAFNNDEGQMGSGATCILQGYCRNFFALAWAAQPELAYLPYAISIGIFGKTALAVRLISVITGTLSVLAVYLFAREIFDKKVAWIAAVLLATLPVHVHFSRMGVDNIIDSLTTPLMLWLLLRGARHSSRLSFLAAGILAGLCFYTYPGSLLAPTFGILALGIYALRTRGFLRAQARHLVPFALAATILITPILGYYVSHPDLFMARMKTEGILQPDNLQTEMQKNGKNVADLMMQQFSLSSFVYIATPAPYRFFNSPKAYLPPFEALFFMLGMSYAIWRIKDPRCLMLLIWFWTVVILGSVLTISPPSNQRLLMSMPAVTILAALSLAKIAGVFAQIGPRTIRFAPVLLLGAILLIGYINIHFYFYDYRIGHYYEDTKDELTYETRIYTAPLHAKGRVLILGNPKTPYTDFKSFTFFAPDVEMGRINNIKYQTLLDLPYDRDILFIALPDHLTELQFIQQTIAGGEWHTVTRRYQPEKILFYSYKLTKERLTVFTAIAQGYDTLRFRP